MSEQSVTINGPEDALGLLRERLRRLHRLAGEPSTREIAVKTNRAMSHTTVHAVLRCAKLPRMGQMELVVEALSGDITEFNAMWVAVRDAQDNHAAGRQSADLLPSAAQLIERLRAEVVEIQQERDDLATRLGMVQSAPIGSVRDLDWKSLDSGQRIGDGSPIVSMAFSPDGIFLAVGRVDGSVQLWETSMRIPVEDPIAMSRTEVSVAFSPNGWLIAVADEDGLVHLWDMTASTPPTDPLTGHNAPILSMSFSASGHRLHVSSGDFGSIRSWHLASRSAVVETTIDAHEEITTTAFSPDGHLTATGGFDGSVRLWDLVSGRPVGPPLVGHDGAVWSVTFSPDGRRLASGGNDGSVRLWDLVSGRPVGPPLVGHDGTVWSVAFSPDGRLLASGGSDGVRLWDSQAFLVIGELSVGQNEKVASVAFSPDGQLLASGDDDGSLRFWEVGQWPR